MIIKHSDLDAVSVFKKIRRGEIVYAGNARLKIFGRLSCGSGKRMLRSNRVFFSSEEEAKMHGFRPCRKCMPRT